VIARQLYDQKERVAVIVGTGLCIVGTSVWLFGGINHILLLIVVLLSTLLSLGVWLAISVLHREPLDAFDLLCQLAKDKPVSQIQSKMTRSLVDASKRGDVVFRELLVERLNSISEDLRQIGRGRVEFSNTESWRIFYEQILRSPSTTLYRSVAHIETANYWQDGAGRKSLDLNLSLHDSGKVNIERIAIVADHLWPAEEQFPINPVRRWIDEQHRYGIWIEVVRESELASEPQLVSDFGIYGIRAVGRQIVDIAGRTTRFTLSFDYEDVKEADQFWDKIKVFSTSYAKLLDRSN